MSKKRWGWSRQLKFTPAPQPQAAAIGENGAFGAFPTLPCLIFSCCAKMQPLSPSAWPRAVSISTRRALKPWKPNARRSRPALRRRKAAATALSKQIGMLKGKGEDASAVMAEVAGLGDELKQLESRLPNCRHDSTISCWECRTCRTKRAGRQGRNRQCGSAAAGARRAVSISPCRDHVDIGEGLRQLDFDAAAKITGSRFSADEGTAGAAAPRTRPVHARRAHARARLHGSLCAVSGERRFACAAPASCRSSRRICSSVPRADDGQALSHPHRRSAGDQPAARRDRRRPKRCR